MKLDYAWTVVFFILQLKFSHAELLLAQILVHHAECTPSRLSLGGNKTRELGASLREEYKNLMDAEKIYFRPEKTSISIQSAMQLAQGLVPDYSPTDQEIANMTFKSNSWFDVVQLEVDPLFVGWLKCQHILPEVDLHGPELVGDWGNDTESFQQYFGQWTGSNFVENVRSGLVYRRIRAMAEVDLRVADCFDRADPDEELKSFTIDEYRIQSATDDLIQYNGGTHLALFLRHVDNYLNGLEMRRLFILVGNDINIVGLLQALNLYDHEHIPDYGSYVALELHHIVGEYVVTVMYHNGIFPPEPPQLMWMPFCNNDCPLEKFKTSFKNRILRVNLQELHCTP